MRHPTFALGYEAVLSLLATIEGRRTEEVHTRVATRLVIRQSCGCRSKDTRLTRVRPSPVADGVDHQVALARLMAEGVLIEAQHATLEEIEQQCLRLIQALSASLLHSQSAAFDSALLQLLQWLEDQTEDDNTWQAAFSTLRAALPDLLASLPGATLAHGAGTCLSIGLPSASASGIVAWWHSRNPPCRVPVRRCGADDNSWGHLGLLETRPILWRIVVPPAIAQSEGHEFPGLKHDTTRARSA